MALQFYGSGYDTSTLHYVIRKKLMNMKLTATVFNDIAQTLHFIHSKGFLHNDLRTNSLLLERAAPEVTFFLSEKCLSWQFPSKVFALNFLI